MGEQEWGAEEEERGLRHWGQGKGGGWVAAQEEWRGGWGKCKGGARNRQEDALGKAPAQGGGGRKVEEWGRGGVAREAARGINY